MKKRELWIYLAWIILAVFCGMLFYLGSRPGGVGPVLVYMQGRIYIALVGLLVLAFGCVRSTLKRPFLQRGRVRAMIGLVLVVGMSNYPFPYPSSYEGRTSSVKFRLPVEGEWTVFWGGDDSQSNRLSSFYPDRRWGLHLVREVNGSTFSGSGERVSDYHAWGQPVLAPAAGRVVRVHDGEPQASIGLLSRGGEGHGNFIVVEVAEGQFCFLAHLQAGSLKVAEGQQVAAGDELGRVGYSGLMPLTPQPHVALFLQDTPDPRRGEAIPWSFHDYLSSGREVLAGVPRGGVAEDGTLLGERVRSRADL